MKHIIHHFIPWVCGSEQHCSITILYMLSHCIYCKHQLTANTCIHFVCVKTLISFPLWAVQILLSISWFLSDNWRTSTAQKATIHQVTTMLATSKNSLCPGHNHLITTGADDPTLWLSPEHQRGWWLKWRVIEVASMVVAWWIVAFFPREELCCSDHLHNEQMWACFTSPSSAMLHHIQWPDTDIPAFIMSLKP